MAPFSRLELLIEAAEYHNRLSKVTPTYSKKRDVISSSPTARSSPLGPNQFSESASTSPPAKKRIKIAVGDVGDGAWLRSKPRTPLSAIKFGPVEKLSKGLSGRCPAGSAHRIWERTDECAMAATSARRFRFSIAVEMKRRRQDAAATKENEPPFVLYDEEDDNRVNPIHTIVRRDIWEGFVVDAANDASAEDAQDDDESFFAARRAGRLARYDGTVGFRCRFCKNVPPARRARRSAVYPRSLERIYLANIRFQRDHIEHCAFIPKHIKESYSKLKNSKGVGVRSKRTNSEWALVRTAHKNTRGQSRRPTYAEVVAE